MALREESFGVVLALGDCTIAMAGATFGVGVAGVMLSVGVIEAESWVLGFGV